MLSFLALEILPRIARERHRWRGRDATRYERQQANEQKQETQYVTSSYCRRREGNSISSSAH